MKVRKGQIDVTLNREEYEVRIREKLFYDCDFQDIEPAVSTVIEKSWQNYIEYHKSPLSKKAGKGFKNPEFKLAIEWLETRKRLQAAERQQKKSQSKSRILET